MHRDVRHLPQRSRLLGALASMLLLAAALAPGAHAAEAYGGIQGKVTDFSSHDPVAGLEVCAIVSNFELLGEEEDEWEHAEGCAATGSGGEYAISGLRAGSYYVAFFALPETKLDYVAELYKDAFEFTAGTTVPVRAEKTTAGIDAELTLGAEISGKVTDAATGAPISAAEVCAFRTNAKGVSEVVSCGLSETDGEYTIRGLPSGSYKLAFVAGGFEPGYFNGRSALAEAETISVLAPKLTPGVDDALKPGANSTSGLGPSGAATTGSKLPVPLTGSSALSRAILSLLGTRIAVTATGDALVKVACAGPETCRAKLTLRVRRTVIVKGRRVTRAVSIGTSTVLSIAVDKTQTVRIKLDASARALLREHRLRGVELALVTPGHARDESVALVERKQ